MVTYLCRHFNHDSRQRSIRFMPCSFRIISEMLTDILIMEKFDILSNNL